MYHTTCVHLDMYIKHDHLQTLYETHQKSEFKQKILIFLKSSDYIHEIYTFYLYLNELKKGREKFQN